ncbi:energy-coupling factor transporter transmembrane component T family protein [Paenibacillus thermotolerans]|uniref:energy-coupling factor transporter transmembrane component T family protein n=1 Tax=Paenibacillus thermotolerans TaxID=3027807 RepID=UPI002368B80B|nr:MULTISPECIES: energy-coupling factor transporter transmembrane component T [unclassified Paenibacillus]
MISTGTLYAEADSPFHRMDGTVKLLMWLAWSVITFLFLDLRVFAVMLLIGIALMAVSRVPFRTVRWLIAAVAFFNVLNAILIILITPGYGAELAGRHTFAFSLGYAEVPYETLFYVLTLAMKYGNLLPLTVVFLFTTHPSRFAGSLHRAGVPYKVAYAVSIAFRYVPELQTELKHIIHSQEARGVRFRRGEASVLQRLKAWGMVTVPLLMSSLQRIDTVTNAMELRRFGKHKSRTWYHRQPFRAADWLTAAICAAALGIAVWLRIGMFDGFWYPFAD